jgi:hypothetical protein
MTLVSGKDAMLRCVTPLHCCTVALLPKGARMQECNFRIFREIAPLNLTAPHGQAFEGLLPERYHIPGSLGRNLVART